jgi:outer membrane lipoprotein-sorting protein
MLVKEKYSMISLQNKNLNRVTTFILVCIYFFSSSTLSDENQILKSIEKEWNQTQTLAGNFLQRSDDDNVVSGDFFIEKPYKSRFIYHNQSQNIITSRYFINFVDEEDRLLERYPIINQPIYKLFSKDVYFNNIFEIKSINQNQAETIIELFTIDNTDSNSAKITLTFHSSSYRLKKWEFIDALGQSTYLEFTNIRKNISIDQNLFNLREKAEY